MGGALASQLLGKHDLLVWDLNANAANKLQAEGAQVAQSLSDMGSRCEIIFLCLPKSANVEEALFGEAGLAMTMAPGTIVIDQTSGLPEDTRRFAERLARQDVKLIDAPVAGGVPSALAGAVTIMASGAKDIFDRALPVLQTISSNVFHCGATVGDGQAMKAINNMINSAYRITTLEIVAAGRHLGLDAGVMADTLNNGPAKNFITEKLLPAIVEGRSATDFALALMVKDLNQAADISFAYDAPTPISEMARGMFNVALNLLGHDARLEDIVPFMEKLTGTSFIGEIAGVGHEEAMPRADSLNLIGSVLVACNRVIMIENISLAINAGLHVADFAPVVQNGSARSAEGEALFASLDPQAASDTRTVGDLVDTLSRLTRFGGGFGMPMLMTNQVRTQSLRCAHAIGRDASVDDMLNYFVETGRPSTGFD